MSINRTVLPSGLTVLVETLPCVRSVSLGYYLRSGSAVVSEEHGGASHFLEHLVFNGTAKRTTAEIAQVIDILGGDVDAFTGRSTPLYSEHRISISITTCIAQRSEPSRSQLRSSSC
jgi:predicted Zn-dependent peptidase